MRKRCLDHEHLPESREAPAPLDSRFVQAGCELEGRTRAECAVNIRFGHTSGRAISTFVLLVEMMNFVGRVLAHDSGRVGIRRTEIQTD